MNTMTKEKKNKTLKEMLGAEAYLEYKCDTDAIIKKQTKIADKQVGIVTQRVEDKFERRLIEEISGLDIKMTDSFASLRKDFSEQMTSQLKWMLTFMATQTAFLASIMFFLHK